MVGGPGDGWSCAASHSASYLWLVRVMVDLVLLVMVLVTVGQGHGCSWAASHSAADSSFVQGPGWSCAASYGAGCGSVCHGFVLLSLNCWSWCYFFSWICLSWCYWSRATFYDAAGHDPSLKQCWRPSPGRRRNRHFNSRWVHDL